MNPIVQIYNIAIRECGILRRYPIYWVCMVVFPLLVMVFFTSMMEEGQPKDMPVGVVDLDNTATSRRLVRTLDAFQASRVCARYPSMDAAREAIQRNEIYAFLLIPRGTSEKLLAGRQPNISYYYSLTSITAGALLQRDLKTVASLGSASVAMATMSANGYTSGQIKAFLQPVTVDLHMLSNPWANYNVYLSTVLLPGICMLFIFLLSAYSIGTELKFARSRQWLAMANGNIAVALAGKLLPHTLIHLTVTYIYMFIVFGLFDFPHPGGTPEIMLLGFTLVVASQGFGVFMAALVPSMRLSMSVCSLWAVLSFSLAGSTFPLSAMDAPLQAVAWLFPLRHYFMVYQMTVFNDYPPIDAWPHIAALMVFALLPALVLRRLKNAMMNYVYVP